MLNITNTYFENMVFDILLHEFKIFFQTSNVEFLKYYFRFIMLFCSRSQRLSFRVNVINICMNNISLYYSTKIQPASYF